MAKIQQEIIQIRLSKLIKNNSEIETSLTNADFANNLEDIVQELVGDSIVVEVEKDQE